VSRNNFTRSNKVSRIDFKRSDKVSQIDFTKSKVSRIEFTRSREKASQESIKIVEERESSCVSKW
jgi:hypothetical protein